MVVQSDTLIRDVDPEAAAVTTADVILTWSQLERRARQLANALADEGIGGGAVWAVLLHNRAEWPEIVMGNARAGSRCMPLNWHLTPGELAELLVDSGAGLIVTEPALADTARRGSGGGAVAAGSDRRLRDRIVEVGPEYETWLHDAGDAPPTERTVGTPLLYTGGTTGRSKGVTRPDTGGRASDWARRHGGWGRLVRMPTSGTTLVSTPLYHALGMAAMAASVSSGALS